MKVGEVLPGSPAEVAGLRPGDQIVAIDGRNLENLRPFYEAIIVGRKEVVELTVEHPGSAAGQRLLRLVVRGGRRVPERTSLTFSQTHVPTYAMTTRESRVIATRRRSHLRAGTMAKSYSKSGAFAYVETFGIQCARIEAFWADCRFGTYLRTLPAKSWYTSPREPICLAALNQNLARVVFRLIQRSRTLLLFETPASRL